MKQISDKQKGDKGEKLTFALPRIQCTIFIKQSEEFKTISYQINLALLKQYIKKENIKEKNNNTLIDINLNRPKVNSA